MARACCEVCGNEYDKPFQVTMAGVTHSFDCFECAVQRLAPICATCACRILGHGVEVDDAIYCCASCARRAAEAGTLVRDRI